MSNFIQDLLGLIKSKKVVTAIDSQRDYIQLGRKRDSSLVVPGYNPQMDPYAIKISDLINVIGGGTVTSIDVSGGTTGLTTSGGPITASGTITLAGTLVAANGGTGQTTYAQGDILYGNASGGLSKLSPGSAGQVLSTNGAGADPSWIAIGGIGTVTSVDLSVPTGLTVSGNPITTSGTLAISLQSGYSIPTTADQSNWNTAYSWGNHALAGYLTSSAIGVTVQAYDSNLTSFVSIFTLPVTDGTSGQVLTTDGLGNLTFTTVSGGGSISGSGTTNYIPLWTGTTSLGNSIASFDSVDNDIDFAGGITTIQDIVVNTVNIGKTASSGLGNYVFSTNSLASITTGAYNIAIGTSNLTALTTGSYNIAIGVSALQNTTGSENVGIGQNAGIATTTGIRNTYLGNGAGATVTTTSSNTFIGYISGGGEVYASNNTGIGAESLYGGPLSGGGFAGRSGNTAIGYRAGFKCATSNNLYLGSSAGFNHNLGNGAVFISGGNGVLGTDYTNVIKIGDGSGNDRILITAAGQMGLGTAATGTPTDTLHVGGTFRLTGAYYDSTNSAGTAGQVLASTGAGTQWITFDKLLTTKVTITSAQLLTSNTTPIVVIANPGANKIIQVYNIVYRFDYQTTPYATNTVAKLAFITDASSFGTINLNKIDSNYYGAPDQITDYGSANTGIKFFTTTGNPTAGDSDLTLWITYNILDVT